MVNDGTRTGADVAGGAETAVFGSALSTTSAASVGNSLAADNTAASVETKGTRGRGTSPFDAGNVDDMVLFGAASRPDVPDECGRAEDCDEGFSPLASPVRLVGMLAGFVDTVTDESAVLEPEEPGDPVVSAKAMGANAIPEDTPKATASAPTRPMPAKPKRENTGAARRGPISMERIVGVINILPVQAGPTAADATAQIPGVPR